MAKTYKYQKLVTTSESQWSEVEKLGKEGWELISARYDSGNVIYIFKK